MARNSDRKSSRRLSSSGPSRSGSAAGTTLAGLCELARTAIGARSVALVAFSGLGPWIVECSGEEPDFDLGRACEAAVATDGEAAVQGDVVSVLLRGTRGAPFGILAAAMPGQQPVTALQGAMMLQVAAAIGDRQRLADQTESLRDERSRGRLARRTILKQRIEIGRQRKLLDQTSRLARVGAWEYDAVSRSLLWSREIYRIVDLDPSVPLAFEDVPRFYREDVRPTIVQLVRDALLHGRPFEGEYPVVTAVGRHRRVRFVCEAEVEKGRISRLIGTVQDVTEQRAKEDEVTFIATHDMMTGLPNRGVFRERLEMALGRSAEGSGGHVGLLLIDVDHFKSVNDTLGHHAGDVLLVEVARRLVRAANGRALVARLGGDEFALLVPGPVTASELDGIGRRVMEGLMEPVKYGEESIPVSVSVGVAVSPCPGNADDLLKDADIALYEAKNAGRNRAVTFDRSMREEMELRQTVLRTIRQALDLDEMILYYQPKVSLIDGRLFGFEALLRWRRQDGFVAGPSFFGVALEDPRLSKAIGDLVVERAVAQAAAWHRSGYDFGHVAINVATSQFRSGDLAELIQRTLRRHHAPPESLIVEVTENVLLSRDADEVRLTLERLSALGVKIALDDFGTGYASLTHLKEFPVDLLKIDRSFVSTLDQHKESQAIVRSIVALASDLDIEVIAEGIETPEQQHLVRSLGATVGQGYLYARPMAAEDAEAGWLRGTAAGYVQSA